MSGAFSAIQSIGVAATGIGNLLSGAGASGVTIGSVTLTGHECPETVPFGGQQMLTVHKLPGGARVIDAMGSDPIDITWSGRMLSSDASNRARSLDAIRVKGAQVDLTWADFHLKVVVSSFRADYRRSNWVEYQITCVVVPQLQSGTTGTQLDAAQSGVASALSTVSSGLSTAANAIGQAVTVGQQIIGSAAAAIAPITSALGISVPLLSNAETALAAAGSAAGALTTLSGGGNALAAGITAMQNGSSVVSQGIAAADSAIGSLFSGKVTASNLTATVNLAGQQGTLLQGQGQINLALVNAGGTVPTPATASSYGADGAAGPVPAGVTARAGSPLAGALSAPAGTFVYTGGQATSP